MNMKQARNRSWLITAVVIVMTSALVAGCADDKESGQKEAVRVALFGPLGNTYVEATTRGMEEVAKAEGAKITRFDSGFDSSKQFSQIQDAVTQGRFDAFIIIPLDAVTLVPAVEEAIDAGIAVVNTDLALGPETNTSEPQIDGQAGTVINPPSERGDRILETVVAACEGIDPCQVGYMAGEPSFDFEREAKNRLDAISTDHPNIDVVAYQSGHGYVAEPAIGIAQNMLQANPDLDVLALSSDQASAGAEQALQDAGKDKDVRLVSSGGSCPGVEAVKEGRWFATIIDLPMTEGKLGMKIAIDTVRGDLKEAKGMNPMDVLDRDAFVSKENLEDFKCEWEG
jgi:ribose transport system substrate-binding protein